MICSNTFTTEIVRLWLQEILCKEFKKKKKVLKKEEPSGTPTLNERGCWSEVFENKEPERYQDPVLWEWLEFVSNPNIEVPILKQHTYFRLENLKGTVKAPVNLMGPNSIRGTKIVFVIPQSQGITNTPRSFCMGVPPPARFDPWITTAPFCGRRGIFSRSSLDNKFPCLVFLDLVHSKKGVEKMIVTRACFLQVYTY